MARSRIATGANGQNGGYRNHPFPTQLPRNAGTVKAQRASPSVPSVTSCSKNPKLHRPGPASLGGLRAFLTFRSLGEGGGGSNFFPKASTLTERRYKPFKIQNPTFKIPLLPRPLAAFAPS
jgi:hypothetical protein